MDDKNNPNSGKYSNQNLNQTSVVMMKKEQVQQKDIPKKFFII